MNGTRAFRLASLALVLCLSACASSHDDGLQPMTFGDPRGCPPDGAYSFYFPTGSLDDGYRRRDGDLLLRQWYSTQLGAMDEPSLSCGQPAADETYRFVWLRSFHRPMAIRVARTADTYTLDAVVLDGAGGYEPGAVDQRVHRALSAAEWAQVSAALTRLDFWSKPAEPAPDLTSVNLDGAQWVIEGRRERYHVVDRWGGDDGVRDVGLLFLDLADLRPAEDEIY